MRKLALLIILALTTACGKVHMTCWDNKGTITFNEVVWQAWPYATYADPQIWAYETGVFSPRKYVYGPCHTEVP